MRGRKPLPTALKLARGNPGRRPIPAAEPTHAPLALACPPLLRDPVARTEWRRIARHLAARGHVTTVDRATLAGYCLKYAQWQALEAEARDRPFIETTDKGYPVPSPALGMANRVFLLMLRAAAELGITPSSRSRVAAQGVPDAGPLSPLDRLRAARAAIARP